MDLRVNRPNSGFGVSIKNDFVNRPSGRWGMLSTLAGPFKILGKLVVGGVVGGV